MKSAKQLARFDTNKFAYSGPEALQRLYDLVKAPHVFLKLYMYINWLNEPRPSFISGVIHPSLVHDDIRLSPRERFLECGF